MSIFDELGRLPNFEEMQAALSSPVVPPSALTRKPGLESEDMELTADEMLKQIFQMVKSQHQNLNIGTNGQIPTAAALDSSYNSSTATYDGLPRTMNYNGGI